MANKPQLLDRWGQPLKRSTLKKEVSAATIGGVRSPISGTPADGLDPLRLANILRAADQGDPLRYLELAEVIEERDPHYLGVLGTRKRAVSQIEITVKPASDDPLDITQADMVRDWLDRDELTDEIFDILDCVGKGYSFTEIIWDTSEGQWLPLRLEWRDPRWFRFNRHDLSTPMMLDENGQEVPLPAFKFIYSTIKAKSGLALRSGLARVAMWGWLFKAYTQRDWAIFTQTYGQPLRVGKWGANASEDDKDTLFNAVANIAGDCAAIIPESMNIEFIEAKNVGAASGLYKERADWLDQQISKAVLGQTATTDAVTGGLGSGKEHREVQESIERADAGALAAILNRDLIRPWIDLEFGPQKRYPRLKIERVEPEDLKQLTDALGVIVPLGLRVGAKEVREKFNLSEPAKGEEILQLAPLAPNAPLESDRTNPDAPIKHPFNTRVGRDRTIDALQAEGALDAPTAPKPLESILTNQLAANAQPAIVDMLGKIEAMLDAAGSLEELREMTQAAFPDLDASKLSKVMATAILAADATGRAEQGADGA